MTPVIRLLTLAGAIGLFALSTPVLGLVGWDMQSAGGSGLVKLHPTTYIFAITALLGLASFETRYWSVVTSWWYPPFVIGAIAMTVRAIMIVNAGGSGGGEFSAALTSFVTPALLLVTVRLDRPDLDRLALLFRWFIVVNSVMAIAEQVVGHRFIPSILDTFPSEHRSTALLGHPLGAALLTALLLVNLVLAPKRSLPFALRAGEILLNIAALFAYGARTSLIALPAVLIAASLFARSGRRGRVTAGQRIVPLLFVLAGAILLFLPIPIVDNVLERFVNDNGSAGTRVSAYQIIASLDTKSFLFGVEVYRRLTILEFYKTPFGIELCWLQLIFNYGVIVTTLMFVGLIAMLWGFTAPFDRSARPMALLFLLVTAGSNGFSNKSTLISMLVVLIAALCRSEPVERRTAAAPRGLGLVPADRTRGDAVEPMVADRTR